MGGFITGIILILLGLGILGLMFLLKVDPFTSIFGVVAIVIAALLLAAGWAFLQRSKNRWWKT